MENQNSSITFDKTLLIKVVNFGALKYGPHQICKLLGLNSVQKEEFMIHFNNVESELRIHYEKGLSIGEYNLDAELAKQGEKGDVFSIIELSKRQYHRKMDDMKSDLFGI